MRHMAKSILLLCSMLALAGCASGLTSFKKGEKLEREGSLDEAVLKYAEAANKNPDVNEYRIRFLQTSEKAAQIHVEKGDKLFADNKYDEALREYQSALALDAALQRAKQQSDLIIRLRNSQVYYQEAVEFEKGNKPREALRSYKRALELNTSNGDARNALERLLKMKQSRLEGYELNLKSTKPITLKFKDAKLKDVFYILSQLSGINFIFDEGVKDQNITIYLENATFFQALDLLTEMNKLSRKVLNESSVLIYPRTPDKSKQYEDLVVKTFYLNSLDAKKAVNLLRTMLQLRKVYVNEELNALVVRDNPEVIAVAQKIIEANDVPDAEVLLEVEVIEIAKKNEEKFGLGLSKYAISAAAGRDATLLSDTLVTPTTTTTTTGGTTTSTTASNLLNLFNWKGFQGFFTVPSATYNFGKTLSNAEVLANPKIRVKNKEKAKFNVGTRVPITTTSTTGTVGGVNVNVQYVDVGVKVNAEPTIQLNNEISIKLGVEVSSILGEKTVGADQATTVVTIGTRNLDTVLNLKDGETSIVGGLINTSKSKGKDKIFLLGDIPFLGNLLSNSTDKSDKTELVLAITPRLVRSVAIPDSEVASFWSGKEDEPSVTRSIASFDLEPEFVDKGTAKPAPAASAVPVPTAAPPGVPSAGLPAPVAVPPVTLPPVQQVSPLQPVLQEPGKGFLNITAPAAVSFGQEFKVEIKASDVKNLYSAPFVLLYDPIFVDFVAAAEGNFLNRDGVKTSFSTSPNKGAGQVSVSLTRTAGASGLDGGGTLAIATFKAVNKGPASIGLQNVNFTDQGGKPLDIVPYNTVVEVK